MDNKEIFNQIVECLALITVNPNVYSNSLREEVEKLASMINEEETKDETKE